MAEQFLTLMADLDEESQARMNEWYQRLREACKPLTPEKHPWTPHVTILIDEPETIHAALPFFVKSFVPFVGTITRLHLCAFWPTREIMTEKLSGCKET